MDTMTIKVPNTMRFVLNNSDKKLNIERNAMILYPFIKRGLISHGKAAEILGIHKMELIDIYNELGMPYLSDVESYLEDLNTIKSLQV